MIDGYVIALAAGYILLVGLFALFLRYVLKTNQVYEEIEDKLKDRQIKLDALKYELLEKEIELQEQEEALNEYRDRLTLAKREIDERERRWRLFADEIANKQVTLAKDWENLKKYQSCIEDQRERFSYFANLMTSRLKKLEQIPDELNAIRRDNHIQDDRLFRVIDQIEKLIKEAQRKRSKSAPESCKPPKIGVKSFMTVNDMKQIEQDIKTHRIA